MRRTLLIVAAVLAATALLAACGDDSSTGDADGMGHDDMGSDTSNGMGGMDDMGHDDASPVADGARRIEVTATSFEFDPDTIEVDAGEDIAIVLTSDDTLHDFTIDDVEAHVAADEGETNEGGFTADEPGTYTFYCSVEGHREAGMEGTLTVT